MHYMPKSHPFAFSYQSGGKNRKKIYTINCLKIFFSTGYAQNITPPKKTRPVTIPIYIKNSCPTSPWSDG